MSEHSPALPNITNVEAEINSNLVIQNNPPVPIPKTFQLSNLAFSQDLGFGLCLAALFALLPGLLMPVMHLQKLGHGHESSILGGSISLIQSKDASDQGLGAVILMFSIVLPIAKLLLLLALLYGKMHPETQDRWHRWLNKVSKWSFLDVLLIAVLLAFLKLGDMVQISAKPGIWFFGSAVVLSILAGFCVGPEPKEFVLSTKLQRAVRYVPVSAIALAFFIQVMDPWNRRAETIVVDFQSSHGLKAGDSVQMRGLTVGTVKDVLLKSKMEGVQARIELNSNASSLAVQDSRFWIVHPNISLRGIRGLETIIGAKYIEVSPGISTSKNFNFVGLETPPIVEAEDPQSLAIRILAPSKGSLSEGAPILYRQSRIGTIEKLIATPAGIEIHAIIDSANKSLIRKNTVFWNASGFNVEASIQQGIQMRMESLEALLQGGLACKILGQPGEEVAANHLFTLEPNMPPDERGKRITVEFAEGRGISIHDPVLVRSVQVGKVAQVNLTKQQHVQVTIDLLPGMDHLAQIGSEFWISQPRISVNQVSGLESIFIKHVALLPGNGGISNHFVGLEEPPLSTVLKLAPGGLKVVLLAHRVESMKRGMPIHYRDIPIGVVQDVRLSSDASQVEVEAYVAPQYRRLIRTNNKFWNSSGVKFTAGILGGVNLDSPSIERMMSGGITMAIPDATGELCNHGERFKMLIETPTEEEFAKWNPSIQLQENSLSNFAYRPLPVQQQFQIAGKYFGLGSNRVNTVNGFCLLLQEYNQWIYTPNDLLSIPDTAKNLEVYPPNLTVEELGIPLTKMQKDQETAIDYVQVGKDTPLPASMRNKAIPFTQLRAPNEIEDVWILGDESVPPISISSVKLSKNGPHWKIDLGILDTYPAYSWHGAMVVATKDQKIIGMVHHVDPAKSYILPFTPALVPSTSR